MVCVKRDTHSSSHMYGMDGKKEEGRQGGGRANELPEQSTLIWHMRLFHCVAFVRTAHNPELLFYNLKYNTRSFHIVIGRLYEWGGLRYLSTHTNTHTNRMSSITTIYRQQIDKSFSLHFCASIGELNICSIDDSCESTCSIVNMKTMQNKISKNGVSKTGKDMVACACRLNNPISFDMQDIFNSFLFHALICDVSTILMTFN